MEGSPNCSEQDEFTVTQVSFDEIINCLPAYGPALAKIKAEYEKTMDTVLRIRRLYQLQQLRERQRTDEHLTLSNFYQRKNELETRLAHLKAENNRIREEIQEVRDEQQALRQKEEEERRARESEPKQITSSERRMLQLHVNEATDIAYLEKELQKMKVTLDEVQADTIKRHVPAADKVSLQHRLNQKEAIKNREEQQNRYLDHLSLQLSAAVAAASNSRSKTSMLKHVQQSLDNLAGQDIEAMLQDKLDDESDEKEAELIHSCSEKFHQLFTSAQYQEAALIASCAPQGVLRTDEIFAKFKNVSPHPTNSDATTTSTLTPSPLLLYCDALVQSAPVFGGLPVSQAVQCVQYALQCGEQQKVAHWIAQELIPLSSEVGFELYKGCVCDHWCECRCVGMAEAVFEAAGTPYEIALCLAKRRKFEKLKWLLQEKRLSKDACSKLLASVPELDLAFFLTSACFLSVYEAMLVFANLDLVSQCEQLFEKETAGDREGMLIPKSEEQATIAAALANKLSERNSEELAHKIQALLAAKQSNELLVDARADEEGYQGVATPPHSSFSSQSELSVGSTCYTSSQTSYESSHEQSDDIDTDTDT